MNGTVSLRSVHGKYLSAQPDGRAEWNRDVASNWEYFRVEQRHDGKIALKGAHGMYVSAQPDGSVQINRREAPPGGWEEFTVEDRSNNVICLKSSHGKYLSAQQNGTAQWNREHAPRGGWEDIQFMQQGATGQQQPATTTVSMPSSVTVSGAGSSEVNGTYVFKPGEHENRHWDTIARHYQHTQNPEIFIAFQDCGTAHQRPEWNKWMIISKIGVLYAAHTGGKIGVPPRDGGWETVDSWGNPGAPGGKHPAPTVRHGENKDARRIEHPSTNGIEILEAVAGKPVRFRINNRPSSNDAWVGIYPKDASDQDHGVQNQRWKWLREIDVNNASFPEQSEGDWSIRLFSDGGHTLHERKDFAVKPKHVVTEQADAESNKGPVIIAFVTGIFLSIIGLPLFIGGHGPGEENLGMIIPGAILTGVGAFLAVVASFVHISSWAKSYAEAGKSAPRWTWMGMVFAVLLLIPGITLLIIGSISSGSIHHHEESSSARLWITDADGMGDQGFIIFIEGVPGDFDNDGIHDYCEIATVNATHSGPWMSDPWTSRAKQNDADQTRQVFELEIAHDGSGCDAKVWPEQMHGLVKLGRACYGCMAGYTDISASRNDASYPIPMWIQDGEKVVEAIGLTIAGSIMSGIGSLSLVGLGIIRKAFKAKPTPAHKDPMAPAIEVLDAIKGKPVRFRINDLPGSSSAWVGIYPSSTPDDEHGEEGVRWNWLNKIDVSNATFPEKSEGRWSIRVFSDSGFTLVGREDFDILPKKERWWEG
ncbi:MAG: fascin domain-containing protein [Candidatus Thalassarchaeaceae archaeon]